MKISLPGVFAQLALLFSSAALACEEPNSITVPDGETATEAQMDAAGEAFHQFMIDMQLYQVCLRDEADARRRGTGAQNQTAVETRENAYAARHNAASAAMERTTEAFRQAVDAFRARQ